MTSLEGAQCVIPAILARRRRIQVVLLKRDLPESRAQDVLEAAESCGVPVRRVEGSELDAVAHGKSHGGVVAICSTLPHTTEDELEEMLDRVRDPLLLLLEGVDDDRNLGFTLRTAESMGVLAVLVKKHVWDFDETEVARSSSGAYERLPLVRFESVDVLMRLKRRGILVYGCLAGVRRSVFEEDLSCGVLLAVGGEKRGLSGAVRDVCDGFVTIPTVGGASSLSLSHAGAILLGEAMRQRHAKQMRLRRGLENGPGDAGVEIA